MQKKLTPSSDTRKESQKSSLKVNVDLSIMSKA